MSTGPPLCDYPELTCTAVEAANGIYESDSDSFGLQLVALK